MRVPKLADTSVSVNVVVASLTLKVTVVAEPDVNDAGVALNVITGAVVSTFCADCVATALCVNVALFAAVSLMVPEFSVRELAAIARPSASLSPEATL